MRILKGAPSSMLVPAAMLTIAPAIAGLALQSTLPEPELELAQEAAAAPTPSPDEGEGPRDFLVEGGAADAQLAPHSAPGVLGGRQGLAFEWAPIAGTSAPQAGATGASGTIQVASASSLLGGPVIPASSVLPTWNGPAA